MIDEIKNKTDIPLSEEKIRESKEKLNAYFSKLQDSLAEASFFTIASDRTYKVYDITKYEDNKFDVLVKLPLGQDEVIRFQKALSDHFAGHLPEATRRSSFHFSIKPYGNKDGGTGFMTSIKFNADIAKNIVSSNADELQAVFAKAMHGEPTKAK